jgi:hypothetical protein
MSPFFMPIRERKSTYKPTNFYLTLSMGRLPVTTFKTSLLQKRYGFRAVRAVGWESKSHLIEKSYKCQKSIFFDTFCI